VTPQRFGQPPASGAAQQKPAPAAPPRPSRRKARRRAAADLFLLGQCSHRTRSKAKKVCVTVKDGRVESGLLVCQRSRSSNGRRAEKLLRMSLPYGVNLQYGTRLIVDQNQPTTAPFVTCLPPSCRRRLHRRL